MKIIVILFLALIKHAAFGQNNLQNTSGWTLYKIYDSHAFNYSSDTLKNFKKLILNDSVIHAFFKDAKQSAKSENYLWMGLYVATCKFGEGIIHKIYVSVYGGFFYDEQTSNYFTISSVMINEWQNYWHDSMELFSDN